MSFFVHPSAIVDDKAQIGEATKIWHFSHVMKDARIGERCTLGQNVMVASGVVIGNNVKVQNNVSLYAGVICEDDVFIGPSVVFTNVINPRSAISRRHEFKTTLIKRGATIGANATVLCGIEIAEYAFIAAGAVVTKSVKRYALVMGNPAVQTGWVSEYGLKLEFEESGLAVCTESLERYRLLNNQVFKIINSTP